MMGDLSVAKRNLSDCLGTNFKNYLHLLKRWFRQDLTKEQFDFEARKFFDDHSVKRHNAFLLALFNRCQDISSVDGHSINNSTREKHTVNIKSEINKTNNIIKTVVTDNVSPTKSKVTILKHNRTKKNSGNKSVYKISERHFIPADPLLYTPIAVKRSSKIEMERNRLLLKLSFSSTDGSLPDHFMANLRMLVIVWEAGLDNLSNDAVLLVNAALRDFMKNILTSVLTFKSAFRTYDKGRFRYAVGTPVVNPYLKNSHHFCKYPQDMLSKFFNDHGESFPISHLNGEAAELDAIHQIACANYPVSNWMNPSVDENIDIITPWHLFHALRLHKATIPSHSVYVTNMEKIINRLSHKCDITSTTVNLSESDTVSSV
ncbi:transcriptional adapter 1-like [Brevipalpus obovatus]|uniref:transcriptional adapter 1-like n=1 Tax=Brevipalpus obovatus TaxID=246614 RepID=UPI003D9E5271